MFRPMKDEKSGKWLKNNELEKFFYQKQNVLYSIKSRRLRWASDA